MSNMYRSKKVSEGIIPTGTLEITQNGTYNVYQYDEANVDIHMPKIPIMLPCCPIPSSARNDRIRYHHSCGIAYEDKIHIMGNGVYIIYNIDNDTFTEVTPIPFTFATDNNRGSLVVFNNELHAFTVYSEHWKYNGQTWTKLDNISPSNCNMSTVVFNNEIHLIGGDNNNKKCHYKLDGTTLVKLSDMPGYVTFKECACVYNNKIHIIGNSQHYEFDGENWSVSSMGLPNGNSMDYAKAFVIDGQMYLLGGTGSNCGAYRYENNTWQAVYDLYVRWNNYGIMFIGGTYVPFSHAFYAFGDGGIPDLSAVFYPNAEISLTK